MRNLIEDLLTLAKGVEGTANVEPVELRDVVEESWQSVRTADANLSVDTDRRIEADRSRLKQFLENLVRNAIEHGGTDPEVRVGDLDDGFFVEDDGPGIPEDDRTRIFEAGYSTTSEGTGYGLHIVSDIADEHGWHLSVSENETGGARFEVSGVETA